MANKVDKVLELVHSMSGCELQALFLGLVEYFPVSCVVEEYLDKMDQDYLVEKLSESENLEGIMTELFDCFTPVVGSEVFTTELTELISRAEQASEIECEILGVDLTYNGD